MVLGEQQNQEHTKTISKREAADSRVKGDVTKKGKLRMGLPSNIFYHGFHYRDPLTLTSLWVGWRWRRRFTRIFQRQPTHKLVKVSGSL